MKKFFFFAAIACVTLASCVKNEPVNVERQAEITFAEPVVGLNTKAAQEVWNNFPNIPFKVWAKLYNESGYTSWGAGITYMDGVTVSKSDNTWAPTTTYYWPEGKLTFIAYAPASVNGTVDAEGVHFTDYTVDTDATKQIDLLYSERAYDKTALDDETAGSGTTGSTPGVTDDPYTGVHLAFKHALSSIVFSVKTAADYKTTNKATITLTSLSISNIGNTSTFTQGITDGSGATSAAEWVEPSTKTTEYVAYNGSKEITTTRYWTSTDAYNTDKHTASSGGYRATDFILLPQTLATAKLNVSYEIQYEGVGGPVEMNKTVDLTDVNVPNWEMGKRYIYNIIISLGTNAITFEPYVTNWEDFQYSGSDYEVNK